MHVIRYNVDMPVRQRVGSNAKEIIRIAVCHELTDQETLQFADAVKSWHGRSPFSLEYILHTLSYPPLDIREWTTKELSC